MGIHKKLFRLKIALLLAIGNATVVHAQEQEYTIRAADAPAPALDYIASFTFDKKIKWYLEKTDEAQSIEAKTKWQKHKYSIEFDTLGNLQDVEVTIDQNELKPAVNAKITRYMTDSFASYKICKIQRQYSGDQDKVRAHVLATDSSTSITTKYEIVAKVNEKGVKKLVELLFDDSGTLLRTTRFYYRNTDNLEY